MSVAIIGVVGAGFMGTGIAESAASARKRVVLFEPETEPMERARTNINASPAKAIARGKLTHDAAEDLGERISYANRFEDLLAERVLGLHFFSPVPVMKLVELIVSLDTSDIDAGMRLGCGHPMGPLALCDFIGLKRMVASGRLGRKTGRRFFEYAFDTNAMRRPVTAPACR